MNGVDRLEGLSDRLQLALSLFEEAEEVVSELGIEIRNEVERLQRASEGKWDSKMVALANCLEFNQFQSPIEASNAYSEADDISRLCNWIGELEQPEEPDGNAS